MIKVKFIALWIILIFLIISDDLLSQQSFQSSLFFLDKYDLNPAYGGMDDALNITARYRSQWQGLTGNPESSGVNLHFPIYNIGGATGLQLKKEIIGAESNVKGMLSYNYVLPTRFGIYSFGARMGILNKTIDGRKLIAVDGSYENGAFSHNDDFIPESKISASGPSWALGFYFINDFFDFGIVFDDYPMIALDLQGTHLIKQTSLAIHGNYFLHLSHQIKLDIFCLVKSDFVQWQTAIGFMTKYNNNLFASLQYKGYDKYSSDAVSVALGGMLNKSIFLAYNYDITISPLRRVENGTHEIMLRYFLQMNFGKKIPETIIHSPRFYE